MNLTRQRVIWWTSQTPKLFFGVLPARSRLASSSRIPGSIFRLHPRRLKQHLVAVLDDDPSAVSKLASKVNLNNRTINIFWDFDNLCPARGVGAAVVMATRVKTAILPLGGRISKFCAYGNSMTLSKHAASIELLSAVGVETVKVGNRKEAADLAIASDMYRFAREVGHGACIVLMSSDQGFAQLLRYCRACGCYTITVGVPDKKRHYLPYTAQRQVLTNSGHLTLCWSNSPGQPPDEREQAVLREVWKATGAAVDRRMPKTVGSIIAVWLNEHQQPHL